MSDSDKETPAPQTPPQLSRRDFLRRAGKEAAETGSRIVPGAAIARTVLGTTPQAGKEAKPGWVQRLAQWRDKRNAPPEPEKPSEETTNAG